MSTEKWAVYEECSPVFGQVLDDSLMANQGDEFHSYVYEHERKTFEGMYQLATPTTRPVESVGTEGTIDLAIDEREVLAVMSSTEPHRRLMVVADVGCGKSTFLRHLMHKHFSTDKFGHPKAIYLDWRSFVASAEDPIPAIQRRFVSDVAAALERHLDLKRRVEIDRTIFLTSENFAVERAELDHVDSADYERELNQLLRKSWSENAEDFIFERLNLLCSKNRNEFVILIDNIDQLRPAVLSELAQYLIRVQLRTECLVIVALRDHTYGAESVSAYSRSGTTPCWHMILHAPDMRKLLDRRLEYFFPKGGRSRAILNIGGAAARLKLDEETTKLALRRILQMPFERPEAYDFLSQWSNYSVRELFRVLQTVLSAGSLRSKSIHALISTQQPLDMSLDDCLIALALTSHRIFYPQHSPLLNVYSTAADATPTDRILGVRLLQFLDHRHELISQKALRETFIRWGYSPAAIDRHLRTMIRKDVVWTDAGAPEDATEVSQLRLSYRGRLYVHTLLDRALYNYLMSFDTHAPDENHEMVRAYKSTFDDEIDNLRLLDRSIDGDLISGRILGLTEMLFEAELAERKQIRTAQAMLEFESTVGRVSIAIQVLSGLIRLFASLHNNPSASKRFILPRVQALAELEERRTKFSTQLLA